ncbi:alkanesulfonate monooxygenase [Mytilinidion resinicola]|uniref:Alkanesulfonate monooxygenase n=1 Tax=Mytilinidion resinicola TaxID=574789 RepID=A0A6A6YE62_9PEZI|nr:alkanesulfonate monooxygenase [Mytilinidion resinicola]KAF2806137.1 alkanesulfonate monooxygenase [Mytilinidion resinicola]
MGDINGFGDPQPRKKWILNAFSMSSSGHVASGLWRHPRNRTHEYKNIQYWIDLAKILDGNFHGLFLADMLGVYDVYKVPGNLKPALPGAARFPISDPSLPIAAMAAVTKSLSSGITASTTYENPFLLARRYSTLDYLTNGRVAWNVVTSYLESAAKNLGLETQISHDERYAIAEEYMEVVYKLLESSWRTDAVVLDKEKREYTDPDRVRRINHKGKYFSVAGPRLIEPSRQRTPFIFQAGASKAGKSFAIKHAKAMFLPGMEVAAVKKQVQEIRAEAIQLGRDANSIKFIPGILVIVDETDDLAQKKYEEYLSYANLKGSLALFGGWTGTDLGKHGDDEDFKFSDNGVATELALGEPQAKVIKSSKTVADILERWIKEAGVDGFNLSYAVNLGDFEAIVKWLIPELKTRGVFWDPVRAEGMSMRENYLDDGLGPRLRADHPGSKFKWDN